MYTSEQKFPYITFQKVGILVELFKYKHDSDVEDDAFRCSSIKRYKWFAQLMNAEN